MLYAYECVGKCKRHFDEQRTYAKRNEVFCCGVRSVRHICTSPVIFDNTKYQFTAKPGQLGKQGVEVRGYSHYNQLLKANGFADCSAKEGKKHADYRKKEIVKEVDSKRKAVRKKTINRIHKEGLSGYVKDFMKDVANINIKK